MSETFKIAVLPGDGIGDEIIHEALKVLGQVSRQWGITFEFEQYPAGAQAYLDNGNPLPETTFNACRDSDAVLFGAMGLPNVRWPNGLEINPQLDLREAFQLYAGLRPVYLFHPDDSPLKGMEVGSIDLLLIRESTEGLFARRKQKVASDAKEVTDYMTITQHGAERVIRAAFQKALERRRHVTLVDKANVLPSMAFFRKVFDRIAEEYPNVRTERHYVDAAALYLVQDPTRYDVIVTENIFGDILSDLAAGVVGGMGMAPSADVGDQQGVFQPAHGSAPEIAGRGIANPVAMILSSAMMLDWLGTEAAQNAGNAIRQAVRTVLSDPTARTADIRGKLSTAQMGGRIVNSMS